MFSIKAHWWGRGQWFRNIIICSLFWIWLWIWSDFELIWELWPTVLKDRLTFFNYVLKQSLHAHMFMEGFFDLHNHSFCPYWLWRDLFLKQFQSKQWGKNPWPSFCVKCIPVFNSNLCFTNQIGIFLCVTVLLPWLSKETVRETQSGNFILKSL